MCKNTKLNFVILIYFAFVFDKKNIDSQKFYKIMEIFNFFMVGRPMTRK